LARVFLTGEVKNANMVCGIDFLVIERWIKKQLERFDGDYCYLPPGSLFQDELTFLAGQLENSEVSVCYLHPQTKLIDTKDAHAQIEAYLQRVLDLGGEGVVLRNPQTSWYPKRHRDILKYKPFNDAEAVITGFTSGRETTKGSRLLGKIGALIVNYQGKRLELSGLTDAEREFQNPDMVRIATEKSGVDMPIHTQGRCFKVGQTVTFKYRELSDEGIPKEARFWRRRIEE
jgi:ATP-dependent DNA ligase